MTSFLGSPLTAAPATGPALGSSYTGLLPVSREIHSPTTWSLWIIQFLLPELGFLVAQMVKNPPAMWEIWIQSLGWEDLLEKRTATHSSIRAWRIPWTVQSTGLQRVGHDWATFPSLPELPSLSQFNHPPRRLLPAARSTSLTLETFVFSLPVRVHPFLLSTHWVLCPSPTQHHRTSLHWPVSTFSSYL